MAASSLPLSIDAKSSTDGGSGPVNRPVLLSHRLRTLVLGDMRFSSPSGRIAQSASFCNQIEAVSGKTMKSYCLPEIGIFDEDTMRVCGCLNDYTLPVLDMRHLLALPFTLLLRQHFVAEHFARNLLVGRVFLMLSSPRSLSPGIQPESSSQRA